jgi:hypothetical protein
VRILDGPGSATMWIVEEGVLVLVDQSRGREVAGQEV